MKISLRLAMVVGAAFLVIAGSAVAAQGKGHLVVVDRTPLIVQGTRFTPSERVRIVATTADGRAVRIVRTSARGTFRVRFPGVSLPGCTMFTIRVTCADGSLVVLRVVPECANGPAP